MKTKEEWRVWDMMSDAELIATYERTGIDPRELTRIGNTQSK